MRSTTLFLITLVTMSLVCEAQTSRRNARPGGPGGGMGGPPTPRMDKAMAKLFGEHKNFSADMLMENKTARGVLSMPGKMAFSEGKSRLEMDMTKIKGGEMPPGAAEQMKQMGMGEMVSISRPDKKESYLIYPGLKSYVAVPTEEGAEPKAAAAEGDVKRTEIGKETVDGRECTKYKVMVKDDAGKEQEFTVWAAQDLKGFPVKMETMNEGMPTTMTYKNMSFSKPEQSLFEVPSDFKRYADMGTMMQEAMMKRFAPPGGAPRQE